MFQTPYLLFYRGAILNWVFACALFCCIFGNSLLSREISHCEAKCTPKFGLNGDQGTDSHSGLGSGMEHTKIIREKIPFLLKRLNCNVFLDAPCGDFYWMRHVLLPVEQYIGIDVIKEIVDEDERLYADQQHVFYHMDLTLTVPPQADLILCRDCLVHLSETEIRAVLKNFKNSGAKYLLTTTFPNHFGFLDFDYIGWQPLNLQIAPFNFPEPLEIINEGCPVEGYSDKCLGLWKLDDLDI